MSTIITNGIGDIEGKIVTAFLGSYLKQLQVLVFAQMLFKIHVQSRTSSKMFDIRSAMEFELINHSQRIIFHRIEIRVVAI